MDLLNQINAFVTNNLMSSTMVVGLVLEFVLRAIKTDKPVGIILSISGIFKVLASIFSGASAFIDKVVPQNLNTPQ